MFKQLKYFVPFIFLFVIQSSGSDELTTSQQSILSPLAEQSLLLQSDRHDSLMVVAGERGHILYSNNHENWVQATVETSQTLTNIYMLDDKTGWAVGHDAVILKSSDGAKTWVKVFSDSKEEAPLLDIIFIDKLNGIAVGAYSLIYTTSDAGLNWEKTKLNFSDKVEDPLSEIVDVFDFHLNDIAFAGENRFYIASEAGHVLRSDDNGKSWVDLPSPYQGSFFGVLPLSFNDVLAYGLRGHLYRSSNAGASWKRIETQSKQMLTDATVLNDGGIIVVGLAGTLLLSKDSGHSFSVIKLNHRAGLSSVLEKEDASVLLTGDAGIQVLSRDSLVIGH